MKRTLIAIAGAGVLSVAAIGGTAFADPSSSNTGQTGNYTLDGVGSDTVQDVWNAFAATFDATNANQVASYNATGTQTLPNSGAGQLKATGTCQSLPRPNGSGSGRKALISSLNNSSTTVTQPDGTTSTSVNYNGCIDFARSSSLNITDSGSGTQLTYVPFADDAVSFAITSSAASPLQRTLGVTDLQQIYQCNSNYVGTGTNDYTGTGTGAQGNGNNAQGWTIIPVLPQSGSGTRSYWEQQMGITDTQVIAGNYPCIDNGAYTRGGSVRTVEEHTADFLADNMITPFSIPNWLNQYEQAGGVQDRRGRSVLGTIAASGDLVNTNGVYSQTTRPLAPPTSFNEVRHLYDVVPRYRVDSSCTSAGTCGTNAPAYNGSDSKTQTYLSVFGANGEVCSDSTDRIAYNFLPVSGDRTCGAITDHTTS